MTARLGLLPPLTGSTILQRPMPAMFCARPPGVLKEFLLWVKCYETASHAIEKSFVKGRDNQCSKLNCCLILRSCHSHVSSFSITTLINKHPSISRQDPPPAKGLELATSSND
ncbi:hypothetical protein QTO34_013508, partial [Cnephaeus nilssonii]